MRAAISPTMRATSCAVEGTERTTLWCERTLQGAWNSGRVVAMTSSGACAPRSAKRLDEVERGRVGPMQVFEGEDNRLGPRPRQNPGDHRRQLPSPQLFGREFRGACPAAAGCQRAVRAEAHIRLGRGRSNAACLRGRRGAARQEHPTPKRAGPIPRSDAGECSAAAARRSIRPRCAASRRVLRETPRSGATCRGRARRRSGRTDPRRRARAYQRRVSSPSSSSRPTSGVSARAPPRRPPPLARTTR